MINWSYWKPECLINVPWIPGLLPAIASRIERQVQSTSLHNLCLCQRRCWGTKFISFSSWHTARPICPCPPQMSSDQENGEGYAYHFQVWSLKSVMRSSTPSLFSSQMQRTLKRTPRPWNVMEPLNGHVEQRSPSPIHTTLWYEWKTNVTV